MRWIDQFGRWGAALGLVLLLALGACNSPPPAQTGDPGGKSSSEGGRGGGEGGGGGY